jgi:tyrosinase
MTSPLLRRNAWELPSDDTGDKDWPAPILWYARGVAAMMKRPLDDPLSWRFFAAIHGFSPGKWANAGYYDKADDSLPASKTLSLYWGQCWHGSWYFLPWHRGYLMAFEQAIRAEIAALKGPDDWTLPYWNYFAKDQQAIPPAFASRTWHDDDGPNPLYVAARYGVNSDGVVVIPLDYRTPEVDLDLTLDALDAQNFVGSNRVDPGFGGLDTGATHAGGTHGRLEANPHDMVHSLIGGVYKEGLMSTPVTAGLDPIFYLHHANIDRLWEVWRRNARTHTDAVETSWQDGPVPAGGPPFVMPLPATTPGDDFTKWPYTPAQMSDLASLNYGYDDYTDDKITQRTPPRKDAPAAPDRRRARGREMAMPESTSPGEPRLLGATRDSMSIVGAESSTALSITSPDDRPRRRARAGSAEAAAPHERVYLNLENITAARDGAILSVYVGGPGGVNEQIAGSVALFGAAPQDTIGGGASENGLTAVLDITDVVDDLDLALDRLDQLAIRVVPLAELDAESDVKIGRLSLYTQSQ